MLVLLITYIGFVAVAPKWWHATQNQWQGNLVKAQKFIYTKNRYTNVIVGSSLASKMVADSLPNTYNLAFDGLSIYDGLEILTHVKNSPKNVFIETNVVLRTADTDFTSGLFLPIPYYSKESIMALRDDEQPIAVVGNQIYWRISNKIIDSFKSIFSNSSAKKTVDVKNNLFPKMLAIQVNDYSKTPDKKIVKESFTKLKKYVSELQGKGVNIVFFEMPVNKALINLPGASIIKSTFFSDFPQTKYTYILVPDSVTYVTGDGLHLNSESAMAYTHYLKTKIDLLK